MDEILKRVLDRLHGRDLWIAVAAVTVGVLVWLQIGTGSADKADIFRRRVIAMASIGAIAAVAVWLNRILILRKASFPNEMTGILVMRMAGDTNNSVQLELVESLNNQLQKEPQSTNIEIHAGNKTIDVNNGLSAAHRQARAAGKRVNARLVVWGTKVGGNQLFPRVTIVAANSKSRLGGEQTYEAQDIRELRLPPELIKKPLYLARFTEGYSHYDAGDFKKALQHLNAAIQHQTASPKELADLRFFTAHCHLNLSFGQETKIKELQESITLFDLAAKAYVDFDNQQWVKAQINMATAYGNLTTIEHGKNLQRCISILISALKECSEEISPTLWAAIQTNLGNAYSELPGGNRTENLQRAIQAYEAALRVRTKSAFPAEWGALQDNLGNVYKELPTGNFTENFKRAVAYHQAALRVRSERRCPRDWARTQNNLGAAYYLSPGGNRAENIQNAIAAYAAALRVRTEKDFPVEWALTQHNLGVAYSNLPTGNRGDNIQKAIAVFEAALRVRTEVNFPVEWAQTQNSLGNAYFQLPTGDRTGNLQEAITAYSVALRVRTERDFPRDWAMTQYGLGGAYSAFPGGDRAPNLNRAIDHYESALRVETKGDFPLDWARNQNALGVCYWQLRKVDPSADLRKALNCYKAALTVLTVEVFPMEWALAQCNLGALFADDDFDGARVDNLTKARTCFEQALPVLRQSGGFPEHLRNAIRSLEWIDRKLQVEI